MSSDGLGKSVLFQQNCTANTAKKQTIGSGMDYIEEQVSKIEAIIAEVEVKLYGEFPSNCDPSEKLSRPPCIEDKIGTIVQRLDGVMHGVERINDRL